METTEQVITQTKKWITEVVIGCNFCPFAAQVVKQQKVYYRVEESASLASSLTAVMTEVKRLDEDDSIDTTFIILPQAFEKFTDYLHLISLAEELLKKNDYEGVYQLASFHPLYEFAGSPKDDAANYTNRSVYPMLHLLREESIDKALAFYKEPEQIPERNIDFAREKGVVYMKMLRNSCL